MDGDDAENSQASAYPEWERYSTINGVILLVIGVAILLLILFKIDFGA